MSKIPPPDVYEFLDALSYLKAYYSYRKTVGKGFSYETWSQELNFNSRSFLRMIITGKKRITPKLAEAIAENNFQDKNQKEYFSCLVRYSQAASAKDRQIFGNKMMELLRSALKPEVIQKTDDFVSHPILPRMLSLFSYADFEATVENFSRIMGLPESKITEALNLLEKMQLITREENSNTWKSDVTVFKVPDNFGNHNLMSFHEISLKDAIRAFELPKALRRYKSLLLPLDDEGLKQFNDLLDKFSSEQLSRFNTNACKGKRVFQANFNIYPVTEEI